jgi:hypothetical protein
MTVNTIILGVVAVILTLAVHEIGHLVAGLVVGFRFTLLAIGPLLIERTASGKIRLAWNGAPALFGGAAGTIPTRREGLKWRFAGVIAGGPFASALLSLGAAAALRWAPVPHGALRIELSWLRLLSFAIFLATVVPLPNGPFVTDGMRSLRLVRHGPQGARELSTLTLLALERGGVRPRNWDVTLIDRGLEVRDGSIFECQVHLCSYMRMLDAGSLDAAGAALASALTLAPRLPAFIGGPCFVEAAYFEAAHRRRPDRAREFLRMVPARGFGMLEADRLRAHAAIAVAEGDSAAAGDLIAQALARCPVWAAGPRAWLTALASEAREARSGTAQNSGLPEQRPA